MNKLLTNFYGGFPLDLNDLEFQFTAFETAIKGIVSSLGEGYILTGVEITEVSPGVYDITPGIIVLDGTPCAFSGVLGQSISTPDATWFRIHTAVEPGQQEQHQDLTIHNAYQRTWVAMTLGTEPTAAHIPFLNPPRLGDMLARAMGYSDWAGPSMLNGWAQATGAERVRYRKAPGRCLQFGGIITGSAASGVVAFILPEGYRPNRTMYMHLVSRTDASELKLMTIADTGVVSIMSLGFASSNTFDLAQLPPILLSTENF